MKNTMANSVLLGTTCAVIVNLGDYFSCRSHQSHRRAIFIILGALFLSPPVVIFTFCEHVLRVMFVSSSGHFGAGKSYQSLLKVAFQLQYNMDNHHKQTKQRNKGH